jgi:hypothetical protein
MVVMFPSLHRAIDPRREPTMLYISEETPSL